MKKLAVLGISSMYATQGSKTIVSCQLSHRSISDEPHKTLFAFLDIGKKLLYRIS